MHLLNLYALLASIYLLTGFILSLAKLASSPSLKGEPTGWKKTLALNLCAIFALIAFFPPLFWLLPHFLWNLFKPSIGL